MAILGMVVCLGAPGRCSKGAGAREYTANQDVTMLQEAGNGEMEGTSDRRG